jgi:hypothetical protein
LIIVVVIVGMKQNNVGFSDAISTDSPQAIVQPLVITKPPADMVETPLKETTIIPHKANSINNEKIEKNVNLIKEAALSSSSSSSVQSTKQPPPPPPPPSYPSIPGAPPDGRVAEVTCTTTKGPIKLAIHESWAPLGSKRFLELVESKFFSTQVQCVSQKAF